MKILGYVAIGLAALLLLSFCYLGYTGSESLKGGSIDGSLWFLSSVICAICSTLLFVGIHMSRVEQAIERYPNSENFLSALSLIHVPFAMSVGLFWSIMIITYLIVLGFVYQFDHATMNSSTSYYLGAAWVFLPAALVVAFISMAVIVYAMKQISK